MRRGKGNKRNLDSKEKCKSYCRSCYKKVDIAKKDMFMNAVTMKDIKNMKCKRCLFNTFIFFFCLLIIKIFYDFQPDHFQLKLPEEIDLANSPNLRKFQTTVEHYHVRERVHELLEMHCDQHKDFDILFCHNVFLNNNPIFSPCFMLCKTKDFFYNLEIIETDDKKTIKCGEQYSTLHKKVERYKQVLIRGETGMDLEPFTMIPNSTLMSCMLQHANAVSRGYWI